MTERGTRALDAALPAAAFAFLLVDLAFRDERDLPGLLRHRIEGLLPRGIEGLRWFFTHTGRVGPFLVTLIKEPLPDDIDPAKLFLPFALRVAERESRIVLWESRTVDFLARYELGLLTAVDAIEKSSSPSSLEAAARGMDSSKGRSSVERRAALRAGPLIQCALGRGERIKRMAILVLASQLALRGGNAIATRSSRLSSLEERIELLSRQEGRGRVAADTGLQSRADEIQRRVSLGWKTGFYLERWSLKKDRLRLEGWGPSALNLLSSLRAQSGLEGLKLSSSKEDRGYELFVFEGNLGDD